VGDQAAVIDFRHGFCFVPVIPPRNPLDVGEVAICAVASPLWQRSTRSCSSTLHDPALARLASAQANYTCLERNRAPTRSLVLQQPTWSCFPSSLLREAISVIYTSPAGHSHMNVLPGRDGASQREVETTSARASRSAPFTPKTHYETSLVNRTYACARPRLTSRPVQFTTGTSRLFFIGPWSPSTSHGLMLVRDSMSRCTSDLPLKVTCNILTFTSQSPPHNRWG